MLLTAADQLPALCNQGHTQGVTFVISPLLSLISDQTAHLIKFGVPVIALTGDNSAHDRRKAIEMLSAPVPCVKVVYTTPESLASGGNEIRRLIDNLYNKRQLARFVIDEAHCVSSVSRLRCNQALTWQWGHDVGHIRRFQQDRHSPHFSYSSVPTVRLVSRPR
jgi:superfamily II DNA helicase RecQ